MADDGSTLPPAIIRGIGDKLYEKRKAAALEVEQVGPLNCEFINLSTGARAFGRARAFCAVS